MKHSHFKVHKSHGGVEPFSKRKLYTSLRRSGLDHKQCQMIADKVSHEIGEGTKTKEIFKKSFRLVDQASHVAAVHYSLKKALFDLGPTGHHFETFVARYFEAKGYKTKTCQMIRGLLVKHEVDVIATKDGKRSFVECKFHNRIGIKNDIKTALYVKARWDDLKAGVDGKDLVDGYLATNTAFSLDAITYAKGTGLKLLGVNAPPERSFLEELKEMHLYPITSLRRIHKIYRDELLAQNIILASELPGQINLLLKMGMQENEIKLLLSEIALLKESSI